MITCDTHAGDLGNARAPEDPIADTCGTPCTRACYATTPASDIFAAGCVAFEMCELRHPFEPDSRRVTQAQALEKVLSAQSSEVTPHDHPCSLANNDTRAQIGPIEAGLHRLEDQRFCLPVQGTALLITLVAAFTLSLSSLAFRM